MTLNLTKKILALALSIIVLSNHSFAQEAVDLSRLQELSETYGKKQVSEKLARALLNVKNRAGSSAKNVTGTGVSTIAHQGQTLLLIWILAGVEATRQQVEISGLKKEDLKPEDILSLAGPIAEQILQSDIWFALAGGTTTSAAFHHPLQLFNSFIENSNTRPLLKRFIQVGVASLITFVGWEVGMQLWSEALNFLDNVSEYERAEKVGTLFVSFFKNSISQGSEEDRMNSIVLKKMFTIMGHILADSSLRNVLLYNTWRLKIATGEFVTLIGSMVSATAIGTAIFPGAGTVTGMIFGLTGGVLSLFIPQDTKDDITDAIRSFRANSAKNGPLYVNMIEIRGLIQRHNNGTSFNPQAIPSRIQSEVSRRKRSRNKGMTALYEKLYAAVANLKKTENQINLAFEHTNFSSQAELVEDKKYYENTIEEISARIIDFYNTEIERLEFLVKITGHSNLDSDLRAELGVDDVDLSAIIVPELESVRAALQVNLALLEAINSQSKDLIDAGFLLINKLYLVGYDELELVRN